MKYYIISLRNIKTGEIRELKKFESLKECERALDMANRIASILPASSWELFTTIEEDFI